MTALLTAAAFIALVYAFACWLLAREQPRRRRWGRRRT